MVFKTVPKVTKHLGYFCSKICYHEIHKIAQSGHTDSDQCYLKVRLYLVSYFRYVSCHLRSVETNVVIEYETQHLSHQLLQFILGSFCSWI